METDPTFTIPGMGQSYLSDVDWLGGWGGDWGLMRWPVKGPSKILLGKVFNHASTKWYFFKNKSCDILVYVQFEHEWKICFWLGENHNF